MFFKIIFHVILLYGIDLGEKQMDLTLEEPRLPKGKESTAYVVLSVH